MALNPPHTTSSGNLVCVKHDSNTVVPLPTFTSVSSENITELCPMELDSVSITIFELPPADTFMLAPCITLAWAGYESPLPTITVMSHDHCHGKLPFLAALLFQLSAITHST